MKITAKQLAQLLGGVVIGNPDAWVSKPCGIQEAESGDLTFLSDHRYEADIYTTRASVVLVGNDFVPKNPIASTLVQVDNVRASLGLLIEKFGAANEVPKASVSPQCFIDPSATVHESASIGHFSVISAGAFVGENTVIHDQVLLGKNARVGADCIIYPGVKILHGCVVGDRCILHANAVLGADGFGFQPMPDGSWKKVPQVGNVVLENDVELGANTCIDRAALGSTTIRSGVKTDNLVHIAHNVEVGSHTVLAAQVGIAGSTKLGVGCQVGGQAGLSGHIRLADGTKIQAQSGVGKSINEPNKAIFGSPAIPFNDFMRSYKHFKELPSIEERLTILEKNNHHHDKT